MEQVEQRVDKSPEYVVSMVLLVWPGPDEVMTLRQYRMMMLMIIRPHCSDS